MSTKRSRRIDHDTAEQLLGRVTVGPPADHDALAGLLAAAAAPAADAELAGGEAALAAYRVARLAPVRPLRRPSMLTSALAKLFSAKVAATALATALGGVAVAAGTGSLTAAPGDGTAPRDPAPTAVATAHEESPGTATRSPAAVPPELAELCRIFVRDDGTSPGGVPDDRFAVLVTAAGSRAAVPGYCAPALAGRTGSPAASPTTQPTDGPTGTAPTHPGGRGPSSRPGSPGATHGPDTPSSRPTSHPSPTPSPPGRGDPTGRPKG